MRHLRIVSLVLALVLALGLFAGCGPKEEAPKQDQPGQSQEQPGQSQEQPGQSTTKREDLLVTMLEDCETFDPLGTSATNTQVIHRHMYAKLYLNDPDDPNVFWPSLATDLLEVVSDTAVQVKIHTDWKYNDGSLITVDDVVYSLNRAKDSTRLGALVKAIVSAEKVSDDTLKINLTGPAPSLMSALTHPGTSILPQWFVEKQEAAGNWDGSLSNGPYMLGERVIGEYTKLVKNPNYGDVEHSAKNNSLTFRFVPEASTRTILVESGEADINWSFATADYARCKTNPDLQVLECPTTTMYYINMDNTLEPFNNKLVRKAIMYAIDRQAQVDAILDGLGQPLYTCLGPGCIGYVDNPGNYSYDPEKAKGLLAEAGYPNGFETKVMAFNDLAKRNAELVQGWLAEIGITATVEVYDTGVRASMQQNHQVPMSCGSWGCFNDTDLVWPRLLAKDVVDSGNSSCGYWNQRLEEIYKEARTYDADKRVELYAEGCAIIAEDCPWVPIYNPTYVTIARKGLQGIYLGTGELSHLWNLHY